MLRPRCLPAAVLAALLGSAGAVPAAWAQGDGLVAQISQAQATPTPPPLTEDPDSLDGEPQPTPEPTAEPTPGPDVEPPPAATPVPELPDTGADPALLALAGLGLLAAGAGMRRTADDLLRS